MSIWLQQFESSKDFYTSLFTIIVTNWTRCRSKYRDLKMVSAQLRKQVTSFVKQEAALLAAENKQLECYLPFEATLRAAGSSSESEKEDGRFFRQAKGMFVLFVLHDPLVHKLLLTLGDQMLKELERMELAGTGTACQSEAIPEMEQHFVIEKIGGTPEMTTAEIA